MRYIFFLLKAFISMLIDKKQVTTWAGILAEFADGLIRF